MIIKANFASARTDFPSLARQESVRLKNPCRHIKKDVMHPVIHHHLCLSWSMRTIWSTQDWGWDLWGLTWLMKPIWARKNFGQWKQGHEETEADVAGIFLSFPLLSFLFQGFLLYAWHLHATCLCPASNIPGNWSDTERFHGDLQCVFEALFLAFLGAFVLRQFAVEQHDRPNKAVIASRWSRCPG